MRIVAPRMVRAQLRIWIGWLQRRSGEKVFAKRTNWNLARNRLSEALDRHRASGKPLLDLTTSNPTTSGFRYNSNEILDALAHPAGISYVPVPNGVPPARRAVAAYFAELGAQVLIDDICLTVSTSEAYSFVFRLLCDPEDELLIPSPSYPLLDFLADIQDVKLVRYPLVYDHGWQIDFASLERAITPRTRGVIVVHPNNPTGHYAKPGDFAQLDEICAPRGLAIIADEVFLDFALDGKPRPSFAANRDALTFTMSGLSKISGLPQMKFAWIVTSGPERVKQDALARLEMIADTYISVSSPVQMGASKMLDMRHAFQRQVMARVRANLAELDRQLAGQESCGRLEIEGGWYAVLRMPATRLDEELALDLLDTHGVYVHPGHFYDFSGDGYLVVSLITPIEVFAEGTKRILAASGS
jgi:alanine-synthesizing transaminase